MMKTLLVLISIYIVHSKNNVYKKAAVLKLTSKPEDVFQIMESVSVSEKSVGHKPKDGG